jgi:hypothetical protein
MQPGNAKHRLAGGRGDPQIDPVSRLVVNIYRTLESSPRVAHLLSSDIGCGMADASRYGLKVNLLNLEVFAEVSKLYCRR